jgi:nitrogen fixation/metabolism regulation signal transduction histidine kinase
MAASGRIRRRLALAIVLTALIPVLVAIVLAETMVRQSSARFFVPEIGVRLDQSLGLYQELARAVKAAMRHEASAIAARPQLLRAAQHGEGSAIDRELKQAFAAHPQLVSLSVHRGGQVLGQVERQRPFDPKRENKLEIVRPLGGADVPGEEHPGSAAGEREEQEADLLGEGPEASNELELVAVFAADRARFDELEGMSQFVDTYKEIERRREADEQTYVLAFAVLLGITILGAVGVGTTLARGVSSRIGELADATKRVGAGDLSVRVPEDGSDEIADLARAFNRMLGEVEASRARIEYLQRIGAWQEMARRLAHEIKNPLTPIQLAVQEIHRRYEGGDPGYRKLVDTTLEIVEDEVGTLRRLVGEFSDFARLPQAHLEEADLAEFLREQAERIGALDEDGVEAVAGAGHAVLRDIELEFDVPKQAARIYMDRQMLRRALINLIRNAAQAIHGSGRDAPGAGRVRVALSRSDEFWIVDIDDNGPGVPAELADVIFDPYVTTKTDGTGLGLAIVKKIVVEHGGSIVAAKSELGGARIRVRLPAAGTAAGAAALESRELAAPLSSRRSGGAPSEAGAEG